MPKLKKSAHPLAAIFDAPDDDELRRVIGDKLLEDANPRGELIALQFAIAEKRAKPPDKKRVAELIKKHLPDFLGDIFHVAHKKSVVFEKGFVTKLEVDRRLVPRTNWESAARAPEWATVRSVRISVLTTPQWWLTEWMKNPATAHLKSIDISSALMLERDATGWSITRTTGHSPYPKMLVALMQGMPASERARVHFAPKIAAKHKNMYEAALDEAGVR